MLQMRPWPKATTLGIAGTFAALVGYDCFVPFAAAAVVASAVPPACSHGGFVAVLRRATAAALVVALPFTLGVLACQGAGAAAAYWSMLFDFSANYPAFYGLPIPWDQPSYRRILAGPAVAIGLWAAFGCQRFNRWATWRVRGWVFLLVHSGLLIQRAVARSDPKHFEMGVYPTIVLGSILLFELCRGLRRAGAATGASFRNAAAAVCVVTAAGTCPIGWSTPAQTWAAIERLREGRPDWPRPDPYIVERVPESRTLWDFENGFVNFQYRRHNPTHHALTYCIGTPREQRNALIDLQQNPPALIFWDYGVDRDSVRNTLRQYILADFVFRNYRPSPHSEARVLEPAPADWQGQMELPRYCTGPLRLGLLAERWGEERVASVHSDDRQPLTFTSINGELHWRGRIAPRHWNRMVLELACDGRGETPPRNW
jgi:hypothetical protein